MGVLCSRCQSIVISKPSGKFISQVFVPSTTVPGFDVLSSPSMVEYVPLTSASPRWLDTHSTSGAVSIVVASDSVCSQLAVRLLMVPVDTNGNVAPSGSSPLGPLMSERTSIEYEPSSLNLISPTT